ncbi:hypothetical protein ACMHYB_38455 [Sorangium sp. So ce1128]
MRAVAEATRLKDVTRINAEAEAQAIEKQGRAEALVARERLLAEAAGIEQKGLAAARTREAEALAMEKTGLAEATAIKGMVDQSATVRALVGDYLNGNASLPEDLKQLVTHPAPLARPKDGTLSGMLTSHLPGTDDDGKKKLQALAEKARELGLDDLAQRSPRA